MNNKLSIKGFHFSIDEGKKAAKENKLLTGGIETNYKCNLKCRYCAWDSGPHEEKSIDLDSLKSFVRNIKNRGGKSVVVIGGGEPTLYKKFKELLAYIYDIGLQPVLISNGIVIDYELATFLNEVDCSIFLKGDSFIPSVQNRLSGIEGSFEKINGTLKRLINLGFNKVENNQTRLALSVVVNKLNISEVPIIWQFCRENNIYPNLEILNTSSGRALLNREELDISKEELDNLFKELNRIDEEKYKIASNNNIDTICARHLYSMYLNVDGYVQPCSAMRIKTHNIKQVSFDDIYSSEFYSNLRKSEKCSLDHHSRAIYNSEG